MFYNSAHKQFVNWSLIEEKLHIKKLSCLWKLSENGVKAPAGLEKAPGDYFSTFSSYKGALA